MPKDLKCTLHSFVTASVVWGLQFGTVIDVLIPRPAPEGQPPPSGLGKVFINFAEKEGAVNSFRVMHGRRFGGRTVVASYVQEADYAAGNLD